MISWLVGTLEVLLVLQADSAHIGGTIRDGASGQPVAGALVALTDLDRFAISDAEGRYRLTGVSPGPQHLLIQRVGYESRSLHALVPRDGYLEINVALRARPIPVGQMVVRPSIALRDVEEDIRAPFAERSMSAAAVRNHPLLSEPDAFQAFSSGEVVLRPESPSGVHVRGGSADQTAYSLDGIPILNPYHAAGTFSAWNPDALAYLQLSTLGPADGDAYALSGMLYGATRTPGTTLRMQGSLSTTQARLTVDGPIGTRSGFLFSARTGFTGLSAMQDEASYLHAENEDFIVKLETPLLGGRVRLLGYSNANQIDAAALPGVEEPAGTVAEHTFAWQSRSLGVEWRARRGATDVLARAWSAAGVADVRWQALPGAQIMRWRRQDYGAVATVHRSDPSRASVAGLRIESSSTSYESSAATGSARFALHARTPTAALFGWHTRRVGQHATINAGITATSSAGTSYTSPRAQVQVRVAGPLTLTGSYSRMHQFAQSLRNYESMVGNIFPADLFVGSSSPAVPVARSDILVAAGEYRPIAGARLGIQVYTRNFDGLVLVAPRTGEPFAIQDVAEGSGRAHGISLDAAWSGVRLGAIASYGWQRVRFVYGDSSYTPDHGTVHLAEAGVILFPTASSSVRLGAAGALGRRTSTLTDPLEWEACNLLDQGCEFAGSPRYHTSAIGTAALPTYLRLDLGVRKHWDLRVAGRAGQLALFGTVTNVLSRRNVLTFAPDPATGERAPIEMRPLAPLVAGIDWRF